MLGIGSLSKLILDHISTDKLPLDINTFLQNVVLVDLNQNGECCTVNCFIVYIFSTNFEDFGLNFWNRKISLT